MKTLISSFVIATVSLFIASVPFFFINEGKFFGLHFAVWPFVVCGLTLFFDELGNYFADCIKNMKTLKCSVKRVFKFLFTFILPLVSLPFLLPFGYFFKRYHLYRAWLINSFYFNFFAFRGHKYIPVFEIDYLKKDFNLFRKQSKKDLFISAVAAIAAVNPEGFTINSENMAPETAGYCVALAETQNSFNNEGLARVYDEISSGRANAVGGWLDSESGLYYYDAVVVLQDREKAIELGRLNNQLAIFDLNNMQEIRL